MHDGVYPLKLGVVSFDVINLNLMQVFWYKVILGRNIYITKLERYSFFISICKCKNNIHTLYIKLNVYSKCFHACIGTEFACQPG